MAEEYFIVKNLGYDGTLLLRYSTLPEAESKYKELLREDKASKKRFPGVDWEKGTAVIRGEIIISDNLEALFD